MLFPGLPELGWEDHYYVCEGDPNGDFKRWAGKGKGLPMEGVFSAWESYLEKISKGSPGDVSKPNARVSSPSSRDTVSKNKEL